MHRVITDLAILDITGGAFHVVELAGGVTAHDVETATAAPPTS